MESGGAAAQATTEERAITTGGAVSAARIAHGDAARQPAPRAVASALLLGASVQRRAPGIVVALIASMALLAPADAACDSSCTDCTSCSDCYGWSECYWFPNEPAGSNCKADASGGSCPVPAPASSPCPPSPSSATYQSEHTVLQEFAAATGWTLTGNHCDNPRIACGSRTAPDCDGRVKWMALDDQGLSGTIPASIASLVELEDLDLNQNSISGTIPDLSNLVNLDMLKIDTNKISGDSITAHWLSFVIEYRL